MKVKMMCGCTVDVDTDLTLKYDSEGFLVCPDHGHRRYGWRSVGRDHSLDGLSALEVEGWQVFGLVPLPRQPEIHPAKEDRRDNRDPAEHWYMEGASIMKSLMVDVSTEMSDSERAHAAQEARKRLDLKDRTGWPISDPLGYRDFDIEQRGDEIE